jgi:hypothetical protein
MFKPYGGHDAYLQYVGRLPSLRLTSFGSPPRPHAVKYRFRRARQVCEQVAPSCTNTARLIYRTRPATAHGIELLSP